MAVTIIYDLFEKVAKEVQTEAQNNPEKYRQLAAMLPAKRD
jgi:hypothetical protein